MPRQWADTVMRDERKKQIAEYIIIFLSVLVVFILSRFLHIKNDEARTQTLMTAALAGVVLYAVYLGLRGRLTASKIMQCIILAGIIMRVGYTVYTHMFNRGNDLGEFSYDIYGDGNGHLGYIYYIFEKGALPDVNEFQLYHPPLYHLLAAFMVRIANFFLGGDDIYAAFEFTQVINCTLSCIMLPVLRNFFTETELDERYAPWAMALIAFFPTFFQLGGRLNNDMPAAFFTLLCIIYTYRWYRSRSIKTVICLALSFGLGIMSKISCGTIAVFTGPVMLYALYSDIRSADREKIKSTIIQLAVFALVCAPLALWYPIRNYVLFGQPLNYVLRQGANSFVYRGDIPWYKRMFDLSAAEMVKQPFADLYNDGSIPMSILRTALYGEAAFEKRAYAASILNAVNLLLVFMSLVCMAYTALKDRSLNPQNRFGLMLAWAIMFGFFIQFNIAYPAFCTSNFRYIPVTEVIGAMYTAYALQLTENKYKYARRALKALVVLWCVFACIVYI